MPRGFNFVNTGVTSGTGVGVSGGGGSTAGAGIPYQADTLGGRLREQYIIEQQERMVREQIARQEAERMSRSTMTIGSARVRTNNVWGESLRMSLDGALPNDIFDLGSLRRPRVVKDKEVSILKGKNRITFKKNLEFIKLKEEGEAELRRIFEVAQNSIQKVVTPDELFAFYEDIFGGIVYITKYQTNEQQIMKLLIEANRYSSYIDWKTLSGENDKESYLISIILSFLDKLATLVKDYDPYYVLEDIERGIIEQSLHEAY